MFHKDTFRLIGKTLNRFISLVMIVLIGIAFMMGLFATSTIMRKSVDKYDDDYNLQDIQLYSSYGFDDYDVEQLETVDSIETVFASKSVDVYMRNNTDTIWVARVEEADRTINQFQLIDGRMPQSPNEAVLLVSSLNETSHKLFEKVTLFIEDEDIGDYLSQTEYVIVGIGKSPAYMSKVLGSSNRDNMDLNCVLYVPNENFVFDYYTTVYLALDGSKETLSYTKEYSNFIDSKSDEIENFAVEQQDHLKEKILVETKEKIAEGEEELAKQKAESQAKLDDAKQQLDDANTKLIILDVATQTLEQTIVESEREIATNENYLKEKSAEVDSKIKAVEDNDPENRSFAEIYTEVSSDYATYNILHQLKENGTESASEETIRQLEQQNRELQQEIDQQNELIRQYNQQISELDPSADDYYTRLTELQANILACQSTINTCQATIDANNATIENLRNINQDAISISIENAMNRIDQNNGGSIETRYIELTKIERERAELETERLTIQASKNALVSLNETVEEYKQQMIDGRAEYEDGLQQYKEGLMTFNDEIEKAEAEIRKAYQQLKELPAASWMILNRDYHYTSYMYDNTCKQMEAIGITLPVLFYLVAALVCMTTMTRLVDEQRGQIGVFRALGFSKTQIISKYVIYSLSAALIGSLFGIIVGMAIFPEVIYDTWRLMYDFPNYIIIFPIGTLLICIGAFTLLMAGVTALVVNKTLKESPSQLLRPKAPKATSKVFLEKIKFIWNNLSFTSKITARNLIRYKARFFMTVIGVAGCTGLLVIGWGIKNSIADIIEIQYGKIFGYDYSIILENDHNTQQVVDVLNSDLTNEFVAPFMSYNSKVYLSDDNKTITVNVFDARDGNQVLGLTKTDGVTELKMKNNGVILSEKFAKNYKIKKGDYITIESANGIKATVQVNDICQMFFQHYIFMSDTCYENLFNEPVHNTSIALDTTDGAKAFESIKDIEGVESMIDFNGMIQQFEIMINALDLIILVIIVTAGALAFVVLINLTQVNISERIREIATLKVLGFNDKEVNSYLFKEILLLSIIGGLIGLPLGVVEHHFIMGVINMEMVMFGNNIRVMSFVYAYVITIVFTIIVLYFTRKPLKNIQMVDSLKSVE